MCFRPINIAIQAKETSSVCVLGQVLFKSLNLHQLWDVDISEIDWLEKTTLCKCL